MRPAQPDNSPVLQKKRNDKKQNKSLLLFINGKMNTAVSMMESFITGDGDETGRQIINVGPGQV